MNIHDLCIVKIGEEIQVDFLIRKLNASIKPYDMRIERVVSEKDGETHFVFLNIADDQITRSTGEWRKESVAFFQKILEAIVKSHSKRIPETDALNLSQEMAGKTKMSLKEAENLIRIWKEESVLDSVTGDHLGLGVVGIAEFASLIKTHFPDHYFQCTICKFICLKGHLCLRCKTKTHYHCLEIFSSENHIEPSREIRCRTCDL